MGLLKFGWLIIRKNMRQFIYYLLSIALAVAFIFVNFNILFNDKMRMLNIQGVTMGIIIMMGSIIFISFANSYFIKCRSKEMAIIAIGGRSVYEIGNIIFFESMGIFILGSLLGILVALGINPIVANMVFKQIGIEGLNYINLPAIWFGLGVLILVFVQLMLCNLGFFIRKEVREIIQESQGAKKVYSNSFKLGSIMYLIAYFLPITVLFLPVSVEDIGLYISIFSVITVFGGYGIIKYMIPFGINKIKTKLFFENKNIFISLSNIQSSLNEMWILILSILSTLIPILIIFSFSERNKLIQTVTITSYFAILIIIGIAIVYKVISDSFVKVKSFKQLLLLGYLKKDIENIILGEVLGIFTVITIVVLIPILVIVLPNIISGVYPIAFGSIIIFGYIAVQTLLSVIAYVSYRKIIVKRLGGY